MSRENLKQARKDKGMTQQTMAEYLNIGVRHYKKLESGESLGSIAVWDALEDFFSVSQRSLRKNYCAEKANSP